MKRIIRLTESDLTRIVKRVISEANLDPKNFDGCLVKKGYEKVSDATTDRYNSKTDDTAYGFNRKNNQWFFYKKDLSGKVVQGTVQAYLDKENNVNRNFPDPCS